MKTTIERIEAGRLLPKEDLTRLGLEPRRIVRVVLETVDDTDEITVTEMNVKGKAFDFLAAEPNLYTDTDLIERNEDFVR
jgi:hypothetical protein